jgi:hypothetical protein
VIPGVRPDKIEQVEVPDLTAFDIEVLVSIEVAVSEPTPPETSEPTVPPVIKEPPAISPSSTPARIKNKDWLEDYVEQRQIAGDVPPTITEFARECETAMRKSGGRVKPMTYRSIENLLRELELWPVPPTK